MFLKKKHELIFLTLTFPEKVRKDEKTNPYIHKFLTNLSKNYGAGNYIWTRENHKSGQPHYHILIDLPFQPIQDINSAWCSAIGQYSKNAVRLPTDNKAIVRDLEKSVKYLTKYITKSEGTQFKERCYARTKEIIAKPVRLSEFDWYQMQLDQKEALKIRYYEHCITVKIWDFFKKSDYFIKYLGNYSENSEPLHNEVEKIDPKPSNKATVQLSLFNST